MQHKEKKREKNTRKMIGIDWRFRIDTICPKQLEKFYYPRTNAL